MGALEGKAVVITGAGRGIGRAIAEGFSREGARICCGARSEEQVAATAAAIRDAGGDAIHQACDVTDPESVASLFSFAESRFGGIDIVVVNAGIQAEGMTVEEGDPAAWKEIIDTNLLGAYHTMRSAIPHLRKRGAGKIIAMGSGAGHRGMARGSAYACAKAGLWMLVRVLAQETAACNIAVNELIPGPVDTDMLRSGVSAQNIELLRDTEWFKQAEDVVPMALFVATLPDHGPTAQSFSFLRREC